MLIADVDVLVLQIVRGPAYLSTVLDSRQLFIRNLCGNENRDDGYSARRFIPTRQKYLLRVRGNILYTSRGSHFVFGIMHLRSIHTNIFH